MAFSHEKLVVYQKSIRFVAWVSMLVEDLSARVSAKDQLERASTSIPLNIAEGNAKASDRDRCRFLQIALGSSVECAACLDVLFARELIGQDEASQGKSQLEEIAKMRMGLLTRFGTRVSEDPAPYGVLEED